MKRKEKSKDRALTLLVGSCVLILQAAAACSWVNAQGWLGLVWDLISVVILAGLAYLLGYESGAEEMAEALLEPPVSPEADTPAVCPHCGNETFGYVAGRKVCICCGAVLPRREKKPDDET